MRLAKAYALVWLLVLGSCHKRVQQVQPYHAPVPGTKCPASALGIIVRSTGRPDMVCIWMGGKRYRWWLFDEWMRREAKRVGVEWVKP